MNGVCGAMQPRVIEAELCPRELRREAPPWRWRRRMALTAVCSRPRWRHRRVSADPSHCRDLRADFGADLASVQWLLNGYVLALASLTLIGGALADVYGKARMLGPGAGARSCRPMGGVHWNGEMLRFLPSDFVLKTHLTERYGKAFLAEDMAIQEWGVAYGELEPYYDRFESVCGTSGTSPFAFEALIVNETIHLIQGRLKMPSNSKVFLEPLILREDLEK